MPKIEQPIEDPNTPPNELEGASSRPKFAMTRRGLIKSEANVGVALQAVQLVPRLNIIEGAFEWPTPPPWRLEKTLTIDDGDLISLQKFLFDLYSLDVPFSVVGRTVSALALSNEYNPVEEYLRTQAPTWDQVQRCELWLESVYGMNTSPLVRAVSERFLTAAAMRAMKPGLKFEYILILRGPQGLKKTTSLQLLPPNADWFDKSAVNPGRDGIMADSCAWIRELAELAGFKRLDHDDLKNYLDRDTAKIRPPYGTSVKVFRRRSVYVGTTNDTKFLRDPTGNRRFWIVECPNMANLDWLTTNRDQLWAEAATKAIENLKFWAPSSHPVYPFPIHIGQDEPELYADAVRVQDAAMEDDVITSRLSHIIHERKIIALSFARATELLEVPVHNGQHTSREISRALKSIGFTGESQRGKDKVCLYMRPETKARLHLVRIGSQMSIHQLTENDLEKLERLALEEMS